MLATRAPPSHYNNYNSKHFHKQRKRGKNNNYVKPGKYRTITSHAQFKNKEHLHDGCVMRRVLATPSSSSLRYSSSSSSSVTFDAWRPLITQIKC